MRITITIPRIVTRGARMLPVAFLYPCAALSVLLGYSPAAWLGDPADVAYARFCALLLGVASIALWMAAGGLEFDDDGKAS